MNNLFFTENIHLRLLHKFTASHLMQYRVTIHTSPQNLQKEIIIVKQIVNQNGYKEQVIDQKNLQIHYISGNISKIRQKLY